MSIRFGEAGITAAFFPVKFATFHNHATHCGPVAANEFGGRMDNHISAVIQWSNQVWGAKRVINNQDNAMFVSNLCNGFEINQINSRIPNTFDIECFCVLINRCFKIGRIVRVHEMGLNA